MMRFRQALFWDTKPERINPEKHAQYIIERVADFGRDKEVRWVLNYYDKRLLKRIIAKSRCLRPDTKKLWSMLVAR